MGLDNPLHIAFLLVILLLVFGAKRLPEMGRSLGSGLRGFKESINGEHAPDQLPAAPAMDTATSEPADERFRDRSHPASVA
jgi:sec-independent protein translocase protein TatA